MKVLCFDIGGTNIKYGIIEDGVILEKSMFATHYKRGHKDVTDRLIATAKKVQKKHPDIAGVGISCAGSINFDEGRMITPPDAIPQFGEWDFTKLFMDELGLPIVADNDVNSFAACECKMGAGKKYKTYILKTKKIRDGKKFYTGAVGFSTNDFSKGKHTVKIMPVDLKYKGSVTTYIKIQKSATKGPKFFRKV